MARESNRLGGWHETTGSGFGRMYSGLDSGRSPLALPSGQSYRKPDNSIGKGIVWLGKGERKSGGVLAGGLLVILVTVVSVLVPCLLLKGAYSLHPAAGFLLESVFCGQLLAAKSLYKESWKVGKALKKGDEEGARQAVSMIVGRDTKRLDGAGITRAAVETVAENTSDGVIAPFLYMALFGAAGILL